MICPKCKELGLKSNVYPGYSTTTAAYYSPYYDENGKYHSHDGNSRMSTNSCSLGHRFNVSAAKSCPNCDWGYPEEVAILEDLITNSIPVVSGDLTVGNGGNTNFALIVKG